MFSPDAIMMMNNEPLREKYKRYLDIISFLSNINVPLMKDASFSFSSSNHTAAVANDVEWEKIREHPELLTFPSQMEAYKSLNGVYLTRIPTWTLLKEPWELLDPLMCAYPDIAAKLYSLCRSLYLDKDLFIVRQLMAKYTSMRNSSTTLPLSSEHLQHIMHANVNATSAFDNSPYGILSSSLDSIMEDQAKIDLLKWVYERENKEGDGDCGVALKSLEAAVSIISTSTQGTFDVVRDKILTQIVTLNCLNTLNDFQSKFKMALPNEMTNRNSPLLTTPMDLALLMLDACCHLAWVYQLDALKTTGRGVLCVYDLFESDLSATSVSFAQEVGVVIRDLSYHALRSPLHINSSSRELLLSIRQSFFNKLLHANCKDSKDVDKDGEWALHSSKSIQSPSPAEIRRRNDAYRSFCLALLAHTCVESDEADVIARRAYIVQLEAFSTGAKTSPRMTARSRLRCAQATFYLRSLFELKTPVSLRYYLLCLGELNESRLICSEETLAAAIGHSLAGNDGQSGASTPDPSMLVRTWMRDEGHIADVMELCRDLLVSAGISSSLYASSSSYIQLWVELFHHMSQRGQVGALIHSLVIIRDTTLFQSLFIPHPRLDVYCQSGNIIGGQPIFGFELLNDLTNAAGDLLDKTTMLLEYMERHTSDAVAAATAVSPSTTANANISSDGGDNKGESGNAVILEGKVITDKDSTRVLLLHGKNDSNASSSSLTWGETSPEDIMIYIMRICAIWKHVMLFKAPRYESNLLSDACSAMSGVVVKWLQQAHAFRSAVATTAPQLVALTAMIADVCEESAIVCISFDVAKNWNVANTSADRKACLTKIKEITAENGCQNGEKIIVAASFMLECIYPIMKVTSSNMDVNSFIWRICMSAFISSQESLSITLAAVTSVTRSTDILKVLLRMACFQWWEQVDVRSRLFSIFILRCCGQLEAKSEDESVFSCLSLDEKRSLLLLLDQKELMIARDDDFDDDTEQEQKLYENIRVSLANPF